MTDLSLTVERTINASQKAVFDAWLNPEMLGKFMHPAAGMSAPRVSSDPKEGGAFEIVMKAGDNEMPHTGVYREISPHDRIVFTWESHASIEDSTVTLTFAPTENGTHVTLQHDRFLNEEMRDNHNGGWTNILETLDNVVAA